MTARSGFPDTARLADATRRSVKRVRRDSTLLSSRLRGSLVHRSESFSTASKTWPCGPCVRTRRQASSRAPRNESLVLNERVHHAVGTVMEYDWECELSQRVVALRLSVLDTANGGDRGGVCLAGLYIFGSRLSMSVAV
ncbi:hypothetical protein DP107_19470 [Haloglomus irregulare]|uniref:Uncharacterized protein n=1 Tax=Haloglomus irregulare TaxID=2234134 RepID=A0A554MTW3_9EURY|nr:hypothetical protein DP107_19470 [Haloglomus irregulare]